MFCWIKIVANFPNKNKPWMIFMIFSFLKIKFNNCTHFFTHPLIYANKKKVKYIQHMHVRLIWVWQWIAKISKYIINKTLSSQVNKTISYNFGIFHSYLKFNYSSDLHEIYSSKLHEIHSSHHFMKVLNWKWKKKWKKGKMK